MLVSMLRFKLHPLKGGNELYYLLHNLNFNIPIYIY